MNDFTKEELEEIYTGVMHLMDNHSDYRYKNIELKTKIQSMIDNYCDHDYRSMGNHNWLHCIKCKNNFYFTETDIC